jgi:hypothetical protein
MRTRSSPRTTLAHGTGSREELDVARARDAHGEYDRIADAARSGVQPRRDAEVPDRAGIVGGPSRGRRLDGDDDRAVGLELVRLLA